MIFEIWAATWQNQQNNSASSEDSDQPGHPPICPIWSESSLFAWINLRSLATHWAHTEDSDQTGRMPLLIWVFSDRTVILLCPATRKWRGIMLYPPKFWVSVRPSVRLSVCPSVRPSVSAHHHSCIGNSSYSFRPILLKLYRCFKDGLKICILFFQNPEIIFYHFFPIFNLDIFRALILQICIWSMYLVSATPPTVFGESFWNFTGVLRMVWRYAYCFFRILKLFLSLFSHFVFRMVWRYAYCFFRILKLFFITFYAFLT